MCRYLLFEPLLAIRTSILVQPHSYRTARFGRWNPDQLRWIVTTDIFKQFVSTGVEPCIRQCELNGNVMHWSPRPRSVLPAQIGPIAEYVQRGLCH